MINIAIIGASGYTGLELIKILLNHPKFKINYIATSEGEKSLIDIHPSLKDIYNCEVHKANANDVAKYAKMAFLALPHKTAMGFAKELLELGVKVVDLSADYRLKLETYEEYYCPHEDKKNLKNAVYGLPEIYRDKLKSTSLVANPGCFPTATLLGLLPFIDLIDEKFPIFIDAKTGVSGAGKKCSSTTHFVSINDNVHSYNPLKHRHSPEIKEKLKLISNKDFDVNFVPHLLPITRGMLISIFVKLKNDINPLEHLKNYYENEKFIRIFDTPVDTKNSAGTNYCDIFASMQDNNLFISSSIDNLLRGASSQAVVNANIMFEFEEDLAIPKIAYVP